VDFIIFYLDQDVKLDQAVYRADWRGGRKAWQTVYIMDFEHKINKHKTKPILTIIKA
jgi:hypothetical protein